MEEQNNSNLICANRLELVLAASRLPETRALWNQGHVLCYARHGEEKFLDGRLRVAPESMRRILRLIVNKWHATNETGTDFKHKPEEVDAMGFRPYFIEDIKKATGINCTDTITKALGWFENAGVITRRKPVKDPVTGKFGKAYIRFNPRVLHHIAERVIALLKGNANRSKTTVCETSPVRINSESSYSSNRADCVAVATPVVFSEKTRSQSQAGTLNLVFSGDKKLEEVINILSEQYPDAQNLDHATRGKVRKLVHSIFPRYRLTAEMARKLVQAKRCDDESGSTCAKHTLLLQGFNRFETFKEVLEFWKDFASPSNGKRYAGIARRVKSLILNDADQHIVSAGSYIKDVEYIVNDVNSHPGSDESMGLLKTAVTALQAGADDSFMKNPSFRKWLVSDYVVYSVLVRKFPEVTRKCAVDLTTHLHLVNRLISSRDKIAAWAHNCRFFLLSIPTPYENSDSVAS